MRGQIGAQGKGTGAYYVPEAFRPPTILYSRRSRGITLEYKPIHHGAESPASSLSSLQALPPVSTAPEGWGTSHLLCVPFRDQLGVESNVMLQGRGVRDGLLGSRGLCTSSQQEQAHQGAFASRGIGTE